MDKIPHQQIIKRTWFNSGILCSWFNMEKILSNNSPALKTDSDISTVARVNFSISQ